MLDKIEPPTIPDGYGISIAYASLLEIIRSLQITVGPQPPNEGTYTNKLSAKNISYFKVMIFLLKHLKK